MMCAIVSVQNARSVWQRNNINDAGPNTSKNEAIREIIEGWEPPRSEVRPAHPINGPIRVAINFSCVTSQPASMGIDVNAMVTPKIMSHNPTSVATRHGSVGADDVAATLFMGWDSYVWQNADVVAPPPLESEGGEMEKLKGGCPPTSCSESLVGESAAREKIKGRTLPDDPRLALLELAEFMDSYVMTPDRYVPAGSSSLDFDGCWQTVSWEYDLQCLSYEAKRVANQRES